jgi:hypothetical protein
MDMEVEDPRGPSTPAARQEQMKKKQHLLADRRAKQSK